MANLKNLLVQGVTKILGALSADSVASEGNVTAGGSVTATTTMTAGGLVTGSGFKTPTGTSAQFLKANGTVDTNSYLTSSSDLAAANLKGTIPASCYTDTDTKVTQSPTTTDAAYELILAATTATTAETATVNKSANLSYNPSTAALKNSGCTQRYDAATKTLNFTFS